MEGDGEELWVTPKRLRLGVRRVRCSGRKYRDHRGVLLRPNGLTLSSRV